MSHRPKPGDLAEAMARAWLEKSGLKFVTANFRCRFGEIDLIMWDASRLVFVEVRSRTSKHYLHPVETIDHHKQGRIRKTAELYLQRLNRPFSNVEPHCRFDVVSILINESRDNANNELEWIKGAF